MRERLAKVAAALEAANDLLDEIIAETESDLERGERQTLAWMVSEITARIVKQPFS